MLVCERFVDEIIQILDASEVKTMNQFKKCKNEDVNWPENTPGGKKVFLRMALEGVAAAETEGTSASKTSDSDRWCFTVLGYVSSSVFCSVCAQAGVGIRAKAGAGANEIVLHGKKKAP